MIGSDTLSSKAISAVSDSASSLSSTRVRGSINPTTVDPLPRDLLGHAKASRSVTRGLRTSLLLECERPIQIPNSERGEGDLRFHGSSPRISGGRGYRVDQNLTQDSGPRYPFSILP